LSGWPCGANVTKLADTSAGRFVKALIDAWNTDQPARLAASLAYFSMFSLAPAIFVAVTVAGIFIDELAAASQIFARLERTVGPETAQFIYEIVVNVSESGTTGSPLASLISFGALLYASTGVFANLKYSLNTIWGVPLAEYSGVIAFIKTRLLAFVLVIGLGFVLVLAAFSSLIVSVVSSVLDVSSLVWADSAVTSVILLAVSLALIYRILPDTYVAWRDVWLGAAVTALLIRLGTGLVGIYFQISNPAAAFEAAGTLAVVLIAIYYLAQIFLFGAIFTKVYASMFGSRARLVSEEE
jgi:membrane protein